MIHKPTGRTIYVGNMHSAYGPTSPMPNSLAVRKAFKETLLIEAMKQTRGHAGTCVLGGSFNMDIAAAIRAIFKGYIRSDLRDPIGSANWLMADSDPRGSNGNRDFLFAAGASRFTRAIEDFRPLLNNEGWHYLVGARLQLEGPGLGPGPGPEPHVSQATPVPPLRERLADIIEVVHAFGASPGPHRRPPPPPPMMQVAALAPSQGTARSTASPCTRTPPPEESSFDRKPSQRTASITSSRNIAKESINYFVEQKWRQTKKGKLSLSSRRCVRSRLIPGKRGTR